MATKSKTKTKITVLDKPKANKKKPIAFSYLLCRDNDPQMIAASRDNIQRPKEFQHIELICRDYFEDGSLDLMFCYNNTRQDGILVLGSFNDGFVAE